jgi:hypothetical protein
MMKVLATERLWWIQLLVMVWANFLFLGILGVMFGGFFSNFNMLWWTLMLYGRTFPLLVPAAVFGFLSSVAWSKANRKDRAAALAWLSGFALGTYLLVMYWAQNAAASAAR